MAVNNFDRDLFLLNSRSSNILVSATDSVLATEIQNFRSDGVVYDKSVYTSNSAFFNTQTLAPSTSRGVGVNLVGPDVTGGCPYAVRAAAAFFSATPVDSLAAAIHLCAYVPADVITNASGGNASRRIILLKSMTNDFGFDEIVYLPPYDQLYPAAGFESDPIGFGFLFTNLSAGNITIRPSFSLFVQRLGVTPDPISTAVR